MTLYHNFGAFHESIKVDGKVYSFQNYKGLDRDSRLAMQQEAVDRCCEANQKRSELLRGLTAPVREEFARKRKALPRVRGRADRFSIADLDRAELAAIEEIRNKLPQVDGNDYPAAVNDVFAIWEMKVESPWERFERLVKYHDWYYHYSDDHRVWAGGDRRHTEIRKLMEQLGEPAVKLYNQQCPWLNEDGTQKEGA